ncbi:MAG TPA: beta-propeller fold lactonase family protein, partial [Gemmatimonadaceae bacterium]
VSTFLVDVRPRAAAFSPGGARAYISAEVGGSVTVVDVAKHEPIGTISLEKGEGKPVGIVVSHDGRWLYAANGRTSTVSIVDLSRGTVSGTIRVGRRPWGIALSRDGKRLYTANGLSNDVSVIDIASRKVIATIKVGGRPWGVAVPR